MPTLDQKKAVLRILGDLIRHDKIEVSDQDYSYFVYLGSKILKLSENDMLDAQSQRFLFNWQALISDLDPTHYLAFKQLMVAILTQGGKRMPSSSEKTAFEKYFSILPNPKGLPSTFDAIKNEVRNDMGNFMGDSNLLYPWI